MNDNRVWVKLRRHWPWLALVVLSLALHLWALGDRSFHHDEAIHAHSSFNLLTNGIYRYDPTYHGPLLYYLTASTFALLGDGDFTARLPVALAGVLLVAVGWCLRRPFGNRAAWWASLLVTISPSFLYYGRFLRMDVLEVVVASAAVLAAVRAARGSPSAWLWAGGWTALAFATKENAYVTGVLVVSVWAIMVVLSGPGRSIPANVDFLRRHGWGILGGIAVAVLLSVPIFTIGFRYPEDWFFPGRAISYWWGQHEMARVAGPWWYHLPRLVIYEFLPIAAATVWVARRRRRLRRIELVLFFFGVASIVIYGYLREKVPWLGVHQVWAFLPLAGAQLARTFGPRGRWWSRTLAVVALAVTAVFSVAANFTRSEISPNLKSVEALTYVQTCPDIKPIIRRGLELREEGVDPVAAVAGEAGWPFTWYWRHTPVWWDVPPAAMRPPLVLCNPEQEAEVRRRLGPGYVAERIPLRAWWLMEERMPSPGLALRYLVDRRPWSPIGSSDVIVLRRSDGEVEWSREVDPPPELAEALSISAARVIGEGSLAEARGVAVRSDGVLAVADVKLSTVVFFALDGTPEPGTLSIDLREPESVAWTPDGLLAIADTWGQGVVLHDYERGTTRSLPVPQDGWYGPRGIAVAADGTVAVTDTGHKRLVLFSSEGGEVVISVLGGGGSAPGEFVEPVGLSWESNDRLLVCDTGNHRLQLIDRSGGVHQVVELPGAWSDFYSRPQAVVLAEGLWVVTDPPASALWIVRDGEPRSVSLAEYGLVPAGVAMGESSLYVADLTGRVWVFELILNN